MATHARHFHSASHRHGNSRSALTGAGIGLGLALLAGIGRKIAVQAPTALAGNWDEALKMEHKAALAVFDKLAQTADNEPKKRTLLLSKLKHMLSRHAFQEENVIYPAMRDAGMTAEADSLNSEHGYVKQYLYDLADLVENNGEFQGKLASFRTDILKHMADEEERLFPRLQGMLSERSNKDLAAKMNREGLKLA